MLRDQLHVERTRLMLALSTSHSSLALRILLHSIVVIKLRQTASMHDRLQFHTLPAKQVSQVHRNVDLGTGMDVSSLL